VRRVSRAASAGLIEQLQYTVGRGEHRAGAQQTNYAAITGAEPRMAGGGRPSPRRLRRKSVQSRSVGDIGVAALFSGLAV